MYHPSTHPQPRYRRSRRRSHFSPKVESDYHAPISQMKLPQDLNSLMRKIPLTEELSSRSIGELESQADQVPRPISLTAVVRTRALRWPRGAAAHKRTARVGSAQVPIDSARVHQRKRPDQRRSVVRVRARPTHRTTTISEARRPKRVAWKSLCGKDESRGRAGESR